VLVGTDAFIGHVGDSRAYLLHDGTLRQVTHDHTQAQQLVDAGLFASVAETPRSMRHTLINCLGGSYEDVQVETHHVPLAHGDRLLLCTDGLTDMLSDAEIALILNQQPAPTDACQALVDAALDHGGRDNVTVVLAAIAVE
jgi:protein phosphatase